MHVFLTSSNSRRNYFKQDKDDLISREGTPMAYHIFIEEKQNNYKKPHSMRTSRPAKPTPLPTYTLLDLISR
jgi:hypothetical protein